MRRIHIFFLYIFSLGFDPVFHLFAGFIRCLFIPFLTGIEETLKVLHREFGIDGQPQGFAGFPLPRQTDGKFHPVIAARFGGHITVILLGGKDHLQNIAQLDFSPCTPGLHIGHDLF